MGQLYGALMSEPKPKKASDIFEHLKLGHRWAGHRDFFVHGPGPHGISRFTKVYRGCSKHVMVVTLSFGCWGMVFGIWHETVKTPLFWARHGP